MMRRRHGMRRVFGIFAGWILLAAACWVAGLFWFAAMLPDEVADRETRTDAIVVLTGGSGRLSTGLDLIAQRRAKKLFVSGVYRGVEVAELLRHARHEPEDVSCCIALGYAAGNTYGNAVETAHWMRDEGFTSLRLVTANYHMPRAILEFRRAMPRALIIPHPVFVDVVKHDEWWMWPGTASLLAGEYTKYLVALLRSRLS